MATAVAPRLEMLVPQWLENPLLWLAVVSGLIGIGIRVGKINEHRSTVSTFMEEIRKDIKTILGRLGPATTQTASPIRLTDLGRSISDALGASAWAADRVADLAERIADMPAYDIQVLAFEYVEEFTPDEAMEDRIKQCAFENGLKRKQVLDVFAIELRDRLLRLRQLEPPEKRAP